MEAAKSSQRKTRRSDGPIATPLEAFRQGTDSKSMRNALAELSMRLMDADDREEFRKLDGVTAIGMISSVRSTSNVLMSLMSYCVVDHLARIVEEQVTLNYDWKTCNIFGSASVLMS
ncbi:unnamed protein product [Phytophthora lilii]|uniref:Unnamed protein product n=1 Tax=Phytophthora lilii TaxID=2077276 RepID=A0A9W6U2L0_9STRA|nr:unnamed protein product [Phytophthora lilii]